MSIIISFISFLQEVNEENVEVFTRTVKVLVIVSRNLDNIPFIASCQLIPSCVSISSVILSCLMKDKQPATKEKGAASAILVCLFLEALYDPYFSYRKSIVNQTVDTSKIKYQPALLQAEVIPFIYGKYLLNTITSCVKCITNSFLFLTCRLFSTFKRQLHSRSCP